MRLLFLTPVFFIAVIPACNQPLEAVNSDSKPTTIDALKHIERSAIHQ